MKNIKYLIAFCFCLLFASVAFAQASSKPSIGLYLAGENGTEYTIESPLATSQTVIVGKHSTSPLVLTDYMCSGGVYFSIKAKFTGSKVYNKVMVSSTLGYSQTFDVTDNSAWIQMFFPMTTPKKFSVFVTLE